MAVRLVHPELDLREQQTCHHWLVSFCRPSESLSSVGGFFAKSVPLLLAVRNGDTLDLSSASLDRAALPFPCSSQQSQRSRRQIAKSLSAANRWHCC